MEKLVSKYGNEARWFDSDREFSRAYFGLNRNAYPTRYDKPVVETRWFRARKFIARAALRVLRVGANDL